MFKYTNTNPNGYHIPDCVIRAITLAMMIPYEEVVYMLSRNGEMFSCDCLSVACYEKLLDYDFGLPHFYGDGRTAAEIAELYPNSTLLLRMNGHLSCSICGVINDIWNCSDCVITDYWVCD